MFSLNPKHKFSLFSCFPPLNTQSLRHWPSEGFGDLPQVIQCQVADPGQRYRRDFKVHTPLNTLTASGGRHGSLLSLYTWIPRRHGELLHTHPELKLVLYLAPIKRSQRKLEILDRRKYLTRGRSKTPRSREGHAPASAGTGPPLLHPNGPSSPVRLVFC